MQSYLQILYHGEVTAIQGDETVIKENTVISENDVTLIAQSSKVKVLLLHKMFLKETVKVIEYMHNLLIITST